MHVHVQRFILINNWPPEMGIYRDNLSAIVIGDNLLPIIVIAQNSSDLSITDIASIIYLLSPINYCDKRFFMHTVFKISELALWKKYAVFMKSCCNLKNFSLFCLKPRQSPRTAFFC